MLSNFGHELGHELLEHISISGKLESFMFPVSRDILLIRVEDGDEGNYSRLIKEETEEGCYVTESLSIISKVL